MDAMWNFLEISGTNKLREYATGEGVKVMIVDTGFSEDAIKNAVFTKNYIDDDTMLTDRANHGTSTYKIISEIAPMCDFYLIKGLGDNMNGSFKNIYDSVAMAVSKNVDILCLSLGTSSDLSPTTKRVINSAISKGMIIVSASGNFNKNYLQNPSNHDGVISVGGLSASLNSRYHKANYSTSLDFVALAENIHVEDNSGSWVFRDGTSFANAILVGQVALIKDIKADFKKEELIKYASNASRNLETGLGYLDLNIFVREMKEVGLIV